MRHLQNLRAVISDVDGVMTNGNIIYDNQGNEIKAFSVKDGLIVKPMQKLGFLMGVITGRNSPVVQHRCQELGFDFHFHGSHRKIEQYQAIKEKFGLSDENICYIGDDLPDASILRRCGFAVVPADASETIRQYAHYTTRAKGGEGVLRETAEIIIKAQGKWEIYVSYFQE